jgi:hypothetical protein
MKSKNELSRRDFIRTGVLSTAAIAGAVSLAPSLPSSLLAAQKESWPLFKGTGYKPSDGPAGLLFSQVGYEAGFPVRVIIRLPNKKDLPPKARCVLIPQTGGNQYSSPCSYWGELWKSVWWVAEFDKIDEAGKWDIEIRNGNKVILSDSGLKVGKNILWEKTIEWSSVDMLERRKLFTKVGAGWQDAGTLWVESPAQSAMIIALGELLENRIKSFDQKFIERIYEQITVGCDYLVMTQEKATELGFEKGSFSHDLLGHEKDILPNDAGKALIALLKAAKLLPEKYAGKKDKYYKAAELGFDWLLNKAKPMGDYGYMRIQRGLSENVKIPNDEWLTRDLLVMCRASLEFYKHGKTGSEELAIKYARKVMGRQIRKEKAQEGFYGHFYEFDSMNHAETSWSHGISGNNQFGADMGGFYPNYLIPLIDLLKLFPDHQDAEGWKETLKNFTYGYLIPGCQANPFYLVPQGIFKNEGPIWFCGTFHGTNAIYGFTAALALELEKLFNEPKLKKIAYGNLQWLAGLNSGITAENVKKGCLVFSADIPEGAALPASMICHVGKRWAGTWFQTRGVICNGFTAGEQFKYDVEPKKINDGPFSLTDEDWIPHSAGWLTGLMRL